MDFENTKLAGLVLVKPKRFGDSRGFFAETWNARAFAQAGLDLTFVQDNHSLSEQTGTLRGLHFQTEPAAQGKLVRCGRGVLFDVAVDLRASSKTYGQWFGTELSAENGHMLWIPEGFAHGFITRTPNTEICYKCTSFYAPEYEGAVRWDSCGIDWGVNKPTVLSEKDSSASALSTFSNVFE